jgi:hypothetical protein
MTDTQQSFMSLYQFALLCKKLLVDHHHHHHQIEWKETEVSSTNEFYMAASGQDIKCIPCHNAEYNSVLGCRGGQCF